MEFPTVINWISPFLFKGLFDGSFHFYSNFDRTFCNQTVETDQMLCSAASGLGIHCLPLSHNKAARLINYGLKISARNTVISQFSSMQYCPNLSYYSFALSKMLYLR